MVRATSLFSNPIRVPTAHEKNRCAPGMSSSRTVILPSGFDLPFNWRHDLRCDTIEKFSGKVLYYLLDLPGRSRLLQYFGQKAGTKRSNMTAEEINMSWLTIVDE